LNPCILSAPISYNLFMQGDWSTVQIDEKRVDAYTPPPSRGISFGILFLHDRGGETLRDFPVFTELLAELGLACLCPHSKNSWWGDRICREFDQGQTAEHFLISSVLPAFAAHWNLHPPGIGLLGIGMGGQGALKLAFKHPDRFQVVAAVAAALDYYELYGQGTTLDEMYDSKEQSRQDTALMHIHPSAFPAHIFFAIDPEDTHWFRGNDRLHEKLGALGIPHEFDAVTTGGAHSQAYYDRQAGPALRFLRSRLDVQSRRLL
jgi:S-formylglutathione hydrolase